MVHPTAVSENNSESGMQIINLTVCINIYRKEPNTNIIPNENILEFSAAVGLIYLTKN